MQIRFGNKKYTVRNISTAQRHSDREPIHPPFTPVGKKKPFSFVLTPLTAQGRANARRVGQRLPRGFDVAIYHSPTVRTTQTAMIIADGKKRSKAKGTTRKGTVTLKRSRYSLWEETPWKEGGKYADYKNFKEYIQKWLDGKIPTKEAVPPHEFADNIIRNRMHLVERFSRRYNKQNNLIMNITHDTVLMPLFERLTGKRFADMHFGNPKPNQALTLLYAHSGEGATREEKVFLKYAGKLFDVTQQYAQIVATPGSRARESLPL